MTEQDDLEMIIKAFYDLSHYGNEAVPNALEKEEKLLVRRLKYRLKKVTK